MRQTKKAKPGWLARLVFPVFPSLFEPQFWVRFSGSYGLSLSKTRLKSHRFSKLKLHDQCQILQLMLKDWQRATGHFDATGSIQSRLRGYPIPTAHQEHLQQLGCLAGIDHATLQQIAP
jgi:hypothetical protein